MVSIRIIPREQYKLYQEKILRRNLKGISNLRLDSVLGRYLDTGHGVSGSHMTQKVRNLLERADEVRDYFDQIDGLEQYRDDGVYHDVSRFSYGESMDEHVSNEKSVSSAVEKAWRLLFLSIKVRIGSFLLSSESNLKFTWRDTVRTFIDALFMVQRKDEAQHILPEQKKRIYTILQHLYRNDGDGDISLSIIREYISFQSSRQSLWSLTYCVGAASTSPRDIILIGDDFYQYIGLPDIRAIIERRSSLKLLIINKNGSYKGNDIPDFIILNNRYHDLNIDLCSTYQKSINWYIRQNIQHSDKIFNDMALYVKSVTDIPIIHLYYDSGQRSTQHHRPEEEHVVPFYPDDQETHDHSLCGVLATL